MANDILIFIFVVLILLFSFVMIIRMKNIISRLFLGSFVGYWCTSLFISLCNPFGLYRVSVNSYLILLVNVLFFILGFISVKGGLVINETKWLAFREYIPVVLKNKFLLIILLIAVLFSVKIYLDYAALFEFQGKRTDSMTEVITSAGSLVTLVYSLFLSPLFYIILPIFVLCIFYYKKWYMLFLMLAFILSYSMIGGRRVTFFTIILSFYFVFILRGILIGNKIKIPKIIYVIMFGISILMYVFMCFVTATISGMYYVWDMDALLYGMNQINETFITYSVLPFRLFDYAINNHYYEMFGGTCGLATFGIIHKYILDVVSVFGIDAVPARDVIVDYLQNTVLFTGADRVSNYSYTNALFFYLDFSIYGVALFSFMFGFFVHYIIKKVINKPSISAICLLFYLYFVVLHTVFTWHLIKYYSIPLIVLLICMSFKKDLKKKYENKNSIYIS